MLKSGDGGCSHVKAYGHVPPKSITFSPKILRHGFHICQKKSLDLEEGPISQKLREKKNRKIGHFWGRKTLTNLSQFAKISKNPSNQPFFEGEKSLDVGKGFRQRAAHPPSKMIRVPLGWWPSPPTRISDQISSIVCIALWGLANSPTSIEMSYHLRTLWATVSTSSFPLKRNVLYLYCVQKFPSWGVNFIQNCFELYSVCQQKCLNLTKNITNTCPYFFTMFEYIFLKYIK